MKIAESAAKTAATTKSSRREVIARSGGALPLRRHRRSGGGRRHLDIIDVAADGLAAVIARHRSHVAQEAVRIGEEMDVRVKGEAILALLRDDDDQALLRDPAKLANRSREVEHMLEHMS